ncbi:Glucose-6-phosphate exchanger SLC37A4 [Nymphon striatum]|nr:Glucose-6-phosphate exchanger SLC37A4 [Nymphon striatum]
MNLVVLKLCKLELELEDNIICQSELYSLDDRIYTMEKLKRFQLKIFISIFTGYAFYAYTRKCVVYIFPYLTSLGLTTNHLGLLISCQNAAYAVSKFVGGIISDGVSTRLLFSTGLFLSGTSVILFSAYSSFFVYLALMTINGLAQGCGWPAGAKLIQKWFSPAQFGTLWSILASSANISYGITPMVAAYICLHHGWKSSLLFAGGTAVIMGVISLIFIVDDPEDIQMKGFVSSKQVTESNKADGNNWKWYLSLKTVLKVPMIQMLSVYSMISFCIKTGCMEWSQLYLTEQLGFDQYTASTFRSSLEFGAFFGGIFTGFITDFICNNTKFRVNPRLQVAVVYIFLQSILLHIFHTYVNTDTSLVGFICLGLSLGACVYSPIDIYGVVAVESVPRNFSGASQAIIALAANTRIWPANWLADVLLLLNNRKHKWPSGVRYLYRNLLIQV